MMSEIQPDGTGAPSSIRTRNAEFEGYEGYKPVANADFPYDEDVEQGKVRNEIDPSMLRDNAHTSYLNLVIVGVFAALFITFAVWVGLVSACAVDHFCEMFDRSTINAQFLNASAMRVPAVYLWLGLAISSFAIMMSAFYSVKLMRKPVGTARLVEIATHIYECAHQLLNLQLKAYFIPILIVFVLIGFGISWIYSGGWLFGALISKMVATVCVSVSTRGNLRTAAAARDGFYPAARVAFRTGASMSLAIIGLSLLGNCAVYLMLEDVRVLIAFAAGASSVAFICRVVGSIYTSATNTGSRLLNLIREQNRLSVQEHLPLRFFETGGDNLGDISGVGIDLLETFCSAISVCAILGGMLPFYPRDPYAICVFNHLYVDMKCGPFGYPEQLSYALYICRVNNLYQSYPVLTTWQSNSLFIALPYTVAAAGIVVSILCTVRMYTPKDVDGEEDNPDHARRIRKILWGFRVNVAFGAVLMVIASAGIFWGLLGGNSPFQKGDGFHGIDNLLRFQLDSGPKATVCRPQLSNETSASFPIPSGGFKESMFTPSSILGYQFGEASSTAGRLFACTILGILLGLVIEYSTEFFTAASAAPVRRVAEKAEYGIPSMFAQGLATGMLSTVPPVLFVCVVILTSYSIYEQYGIALLSVGLLSIIGIVHVADSFDSIASSSGQMAKLADLSRDVVDVTNALETAGKTNAAISNLLCNASAMISSVALLTPFVTMAGLVRLGREIVGTSEIRATIHVTANDPVSMDSFHVRLCMMLGVMIPFLFGGLVLGSGMKAANAMVVGVRRHIDHVEEFVREGGFAKARLMSCLGYARRASVIEGLLPIIVMFFSPIVVGFGFGQKCLIGFAITTTASIFVIGSVFSDTGEIWGNALKHIELGQLMGAEEEHGGGSASSIRETAMICDCLGKALKDTAGSAMSILMKLIPYIGFLAVGRMYADGEYGWIGAAIFGALVVFFAIYASMKRRWNIRMMKEARERTDRDVILPPPKKQSPFYEEGFTVDPREDVMPDSHAADMLEIIGSPRQPVRLVDIPGIGERNEKIDGPQSLMMPSPRARMAEGVFKDEVREEVTGNTD